MSLPLVVAVAEGSPAQRAGLRPGDQLVTMGGQVPRDIIEYRFLADEPVVELVVDRAGIELDLTVEKAVGEALGAEINSALFDRVRTCDNHCEFCFIYQLPPQMRRSLYLKDDDYRLSFLYGNFTTLTRFTEADLERVVTEGLSPLYVSIHSTDPEVRAGMLRNRRGAVSLRWLRALLDHGIEVHGQVVVCPGVNDGDVLDATFAGVMDQYPELASVACVPLGISRFSTEPGLNHHTVLGARRVCEIAEQWQQRFHDVLGRRMVYLSDEYYLLAELGFPDRELYDGFPQHENGIGMARAFEAEFTGQVDVPLGPRGGFFQSVDGAPAEGYRAERNPDGGLLQPTPRRSAPVGVLTGTYGARILAPLLRSLDRSDVRLVTVDNAYFGGNVAVAGLMVGEDLRRVLAAEPEGHRYLLPDVCLNEGRFLDGLTPADLPRPVEVVATDGLSLRRALDPVG